MRRYETIVIVDPDLASEERDAVFERLRELILQMDGFWIADEQWGVKKLAYEIKKKPRGYYARVDFCGSAGLVNEIERVFQIDDRVLKYMTVLLDKEPDIEQIKAELEAAKAAETASAPEAAEPAGEPSSEPAPEPAEAETAQPEATEEEKKEE